MALHDPMPESPAMEIVKLRNRVHELETALRQSDEALSECMSCLTDVLNSRVGRHLYKQCHAAQLNAGMVLQKSNVS